MVTVRYREQRRVWEVDYREAGQRRRETFPDERAATAYASEVAERLERQAPLPADREIKFADFVQLWKPVDALRTEARTFTTRVDCLTRYVLPALGQMQVRHLRAEHVVALMVQLQQRGLSANTVRLAKDALSIVCRYAVVRQLLKANPAIQLGPYAKVGGTPAVKEPHPLSDRQLAAFSMAMAGRPLAMMATCGLRPSEARALQVSDIDWVTGTLRVERALTPDNRVKGTKTGRARDVEMPDALHAPLRRHVADLRAQGIARGWGEPTWLFPASSTNAPVDARLLRRIFRRGLKRAGLRGFRPYDLRATCASLLLGGGALPGYVADLLGNSVLVLYKHYAKWMPKAGGRRWVNLLGAYVAHNPGTTMWNQRAQSSPLDPNREPQVLDVTNGEPWWDRTTDPLIKSQVLYQLS